MASVELRPGDTLNIVWTSVQDTPLGTKEVESSFAFGYDELLARLRSRGRAGKSRRSGTEGARFSRIVALATTALRKGQWSTGAEIDRSEVFAKMMERFEALGRGEYANITANAREAMLALYRNEKALDAEGKRRLKGALDLMGLGGKV